MNNTENFHVEMSDARISKLLGDLKIRFEKHAERHPGLTWEQVRVRLEANQDKLWSILAMEDTGGEPDVVVLDESSKAMLFIDCAAESPAGRRSICYDRAAWDARKANKPETSAMELAEAMGVRMLDEQQYRRLQEIAPFDLKTSSWVLTPPDVRELGGALFCDRRFGRVFTYHNGADSYYGARGFRAFLSL